MTLSAEDKKSIKSEFVGLVKILVRLKFRLYLQSELTN